MSAARVLVAVLDAHERHEQPTCRSLAPEVGLHWRTVYDHLVALRSAGLVAWEPDTQRTLRPLVARIDAWVAPSAPVDETLDTRELCDLWDELANTGAAEGPSAVWGRS